MSPALFVDIAVIPALRLLPDRMDTPAARAMVVAICLQESRLKHRQQLAGPALGYPQFEIGGIAGVLTHKASRPHIERVLMALDLIPAASLCYVAVEHNDVLAACFARLLLWTDPAALPSRDDVDGAWAVYLRTWRPGRPHPATWKAAYEQAWALVAGRA